MYANPYPGKFIVVEGLDGSGQSTQAKLLKNYLEEKGRQVFVTKEPTGASDAGKEIIEVLSRRKTISSLALQELFSEDRKAHLERAIIPALQKGMIVISDRYVMSSLAFGSIDCDLEWLKKINNAFMLPDLTIILKTSAEVSLARIYARGKDIELFEKKEKLEKVTVNYDRIAKMFDHCITLDGEQSIEMVHQGVLQCIDQLLS